MNCSACEVGVLEAVGETVVMPVIQNHKSVDIKCPLTMYVCSLDICSRVEFVANENFLSDTKKFLGTNLISSM